MPFFEIPNFMVVGAQAKHGNQELVREHEAENLAFRSTFLSFRPRCRQMMLLEPALCLFPMLCVKKRANYGCKDTAARDVVVLRVLAGRILCLLRNSIMRATLATCRLCCDFQLRTFSQQSPLLYRLLVPGSQKYAKHTGSLLRCYNKQVGPCLLMYCWGRGLQHQMIPSPYD